MSNAHEVLLDVKTARMRDAAEAQAWRKLMVRCRKPAGLTMLIWLGVVGSLVWGGLILALNLKDPKAGLPMGSFGPLVGLFFMSWSLLGQVLGRTNALLELIKQEAPELHAKLKDERVL
ncbi:MAG: hypothetical protein IPL39_10260 [Opitutaceae bacterium]|nr:hypothetical protein [Opitutaceae bacterium]